LGSRLKDQRPDNETASRSWRSAIVWQPAHIIPAAKIASAAIDLVISRFNSA
jgi:hypothetical protein